MRVVYTRHLFMPKSWMGVMQMRMALAWQRTDDPEAVFDKLAMSAFEGTPLSFALRDCGIRALAIVGIATEIGIEPTAWHAADLGIVPVLLADACGAGHEEAAVRSIESLRFAGDAIISDVETFATLLSSGAGRADTV